MSVSESITGLDCNTTYHYRLVGVNSQGTSYGEDQTFKTSLCPVSKPTVTTGSATSVGTSSATLNGTVNPNGATTTYYFRYGTTQNYGMTTTITSVGSGNDAVSASASITELSDNTIYYFALVGVNSAGASSGTEDRSFVTNSGYLPVP
ncbi:MAG: hypothetical protein HQ561_16075 [Desulfobacteraceae bacterium]|nr:hypothetical protein [Desulfobacteraceae bacterium]